MDQWDVEKADAATAGLVRTRGATEVFNLFARYAGRDFRSIGHKAIYLANAWRTLQVIGWHHAEPVLRSLAFAMLNHSDEPNPSTSGLAADRPWRDNAERLDRLRSIGDFGQFFGHFPQGFPLHRIVGPIAPLFAFHQTRLSQGLKVLGYGGFGNPESMGERTHAQVAREQNLKDPKPVFVRQGFTSWDKIIHCDLIYRMLN